MNENIKAELIINATLVSADNKAQLYEFVLDESLNVVASGYVESLAKGIVTPIDTKSAKLCSMLFELNHVRVNPKLDNTQILANLARELETSGVYIYNPPSADLMAMCFKPLGELSDVVRFYLTADSKFVFLSNSVKLSVVQ